MKYALMKSLKEEFPLGLMSRMLGVSRSGYYAWLIRPLSRRAQEDACLEVAIQAAHRRTRGIYGRERMQAELKADGFSVGVGRVRRLRRTLGLWCGQKRKFKATTNSNHGLPVAENLLQQDFTTHRPHQVWVADITYIAATQGWWYVAGIRDLHTGEVVGHAQGERMTQALVIRALEGAVKHHCPKPGLIHHSDRGSQYCGHAYQHLLKKFNMVCSMSRKGNCYDNAPMESFWGTLKTELVYRQPIQSWAQINNNVTEYIEIFYNRQRRQARLGYLAPAVFAQQWRQQHNAVA